MKTQNIIRNWTRLLAILWLLFSSNAANATTYEWRASLGGTFVEDALSEAKLISLRGDVRMFHEFNSPLSVNVEAGVLLETGSTQALFTDEFVPETTLKLREARLNWNPWSFFGVQAGAINQRHHGSPLLVDGFSFPAIFEFLEWKPGNFIFQVNSQQAIATSTSFSTRAIGKEDTPYLITGAIKAKYLSPSDKVSLATRATFFQFKNMTRGIAHDSRFYGNTVVGIGPEGALFFHEYQGFELGIDSKFTLFENFRLELGNSFIRNPKAPKSNNQGTYYFTKLTYFDENIEISPKFGVFKNESDSSVAYYNSQSLGHNNREGITAGFSVHLPKDKLWIEGSYVKSDLISVSPIQADRTYYEIHVITDYTSF